MTETERIRRLYDDRAATYDRSLGIVERILLGRFRQAYGALLRGETIEVGIGSGLNIPFYSPEVTRAVGVDLSREMLRYARERASQPRHPLRTGAGRRRSTPLPGCRVRHRRHLVGALHDPGPGQGAAGAGPGLPPRTGRIVMLEHVRSTARPLAAAAKGSFTAQRARHWLPSRPGHLRPGALARFLDRRDPESTLRFRPAGGSASTSQRRATLDLIRSMLEA